MDLELVGTRIRRERERAGYNQRELAKRSELSQSTLNRIENGTRANVSLAEIDRLATALDIPVRLLTSGNPVRDRVQIAARTNDLIAEDREVALRHVLEVLELDARLDKLGIALDRQRQRRRSMSLAVPDASLDLEQQAKELADLVRSALGLASAPISDVDELIEQLSGVDTAVLRLPDTTDGFTVTDPERDTTLIAVRACDVPERQRFTFAHELGHLLWGDGAQAHQLNVGRTPGERRCDAFARHLLAPEAGIRAWLATEQLVKGETVDERTAALLARHFRVSFMVILIQLESMSWISAEQKQRLRGPSGAELSQRYGWGPVYEKEQEAARFVQAPRRILERAIDAYRLNLIGVRALAMLEGRKAEEAEQRLVAAGIVPTPATPRRADLSRLIARGLPQGG